MSLADWAQRHPSDIANKAGVTTAAGPLAAATSAEARCVAASVASAAAAEVRPLRIPSVDP